MEGETASSTINIERDTLKQREAINGFVKAFNDLKALLAITRFTGDSETAGELLGDNTVRTIESRLRSVLTGGVEGGELSPLTS